MTNEQYLRVSYFAAAAIGLALAALTAWELRGPLRRALAGAARPLARIVRRALGVWLLLGVLLGFLSVSYIDCQHHDYREVVADRDHLVATTRAHAREMTGYLAAFALAYGLVVGAVLMGKARAAEPPARGDPNHGTVRGD